MVSLARLYLLLGPSGKDYRENSNLFLLLCNENQKQILDLVPLCSVFQSRKFCCRPPPAENEAFFITTAQMKNQTYIGQPHYSSKYTSPY